MLERIVDAQHFLLKREPGVLVDKADAIADFPQAYIRIIFTQKEPVFGSYNFV